MAVLELQTNLHCEKCVAKIKPHFDQDPAIENWAVDLTPDVKTLKVEGGNITEKLVAELLSKEGYKITGQKQNISNFSFRTQQISPTTFATDFDRFDFITSS